ncbi:ribonuclease III domain-containing protein [Fusarium mexicanum]|uniref:Ribonuclease III domain-containing protein n=1 Tax=Fusarium mexicanum TaxID=751941 RepID=A0A8H5N236_9HYPO|nr:ribonuclease III domain-containing protein [Fusarium mexicanum]
MTSCPRFSRKVAECESIIAYEFNSKSLCAQALHTAADSMSVCVMDGSFKKMPKNDRLAVYGDAAAAAYLCSLWIKGGLPKRDDRVQILLLFGRENGLHRCINMNGGTTRVSSGMVATTVEAILGAVEIDGGRDALARVMNRLGLTQHGLLSSVPSQLPRDSSIFPTHDPEFCLGNLLKRSQERVPLRATARDASISSGTSVARLASHSDSVLTSLEKLFRRAFWIMDWEYGGIPR